MVEENEGTEPENTPNEEEPEKTPEEEPTSEKTPKEAEPSLTKEQRSKLDSFDRIYAENKEMKKKIASIVSEEKPEGKTPEGVEEWVASSDPLEVVKLGKALKDYSEEETEFIIRNAPSKDIEGIIKAEKDPWVQSAIQATRVKVANQNKIPGPSSPLGFQKVEDISKIVKEGRIEEEVSRQMEELLRKGGIKEGGI